MVKLSGKEMATKGRKFTKDFCDFFASLWAFLF